MLKSPLAKQLSLQFNVGEAEDEWIALCASRKLRRAAFCGSASSPWRLWFEADRLTAEYFWDDSPNDAGRALGNMLAHVPKPDRWHVTIGREIEIPRGLTTALKKFASHEVKEST